MPRRYAFFAYALIAYAVGMAATAYLTGFIAGVGVPKAVNDGPGGPVWLAIAVDLGLIALFGAQHSATARRRFKARWTRAVSPTIERSTYLLMSSAMTALLVWFWRPIPVTLWHAEAPGLVVALRIAFLAVLAAMVLTTFQLGHFRFFGIAQAWDRLRGRIGREPGFRTGWLYAHVRHPISLGWILLPWLVPHMTVGQAVLGIGVAAYVAIAAPHEEAELEAAIGHAYRRYRTDVPAFVPGLYRLTPNTRPVGDDLL